MDIGESSRPSKRWSARNRGRFGPEEVSPNLWWKIGIVNTIGFGGMIIYVLLFREEKALALWLNAGTCVSNWLILYLLRHLIATLPDSD